MSGLDRGIRRRHRRLATSVQGHHHETKTWLLIAIAAVLITSCSGGGSDPSQQSANSHTTRTDECVPPTPVTRSGYTLKGFCPKSTQLPIGGSTQITIDAVHEGPCWDPPDFAGSFWQTDTDLPHREMAALHGGITGTMKLVSRDTAVFDGPAVKVRERLHEPFQRIPKHGHFHLRFHRLPGPIRRASCA